MNVPFETCALLLDISAVIITMNNDELRALLKDIILWVVVAVALLGAAKLILF